MRDAETLGAAVEGLLRAAPGLTAHAVLAAERAEIVDLGWGPDNAHRGTSHLVSMAAMLGPIVREHGDLPLSQAFALLVRSGHDRATEIEAALAASNRPWRPAPQPDGPQR